MKPRTIGELRNYLDQFESNWDAETKEVFGSFNSQHLFLETEKGIGHAELKFHYEFGLVAWQVDKQDQKNEVHPKPVSKEDMVQAMNNLYTDLLMLEDGSWEPDPSSVDASIESLETIAKYSGIQLEDKRDGVVE